MFHSNVQYSTRNSENKFLENRKILNPEPKFNSIWVFITESDKLLDTDKGEEESGFVWEYNFSPRVGHVAKYWDICRKLGVLTHIYIRVLGILCNVN